VNEAFRVAMEDFQRRRRSLVALPLWIPTPRNRAMRGAIDALDRIVYSILSRRRAEPGAHGDLLDLMMGAREAGERMSDRQLRDEVMTLLLAGHETTANLLTWTWYLVGQHPEVERRLHEEVDAVLGDRTPGAADVPALRYTGQVLQEALRLYPPAWVFTRQAIAADAIGGFEIPTGSVLIVSPYLTHRHPDFWPDPERFDPDRFESGAGERRRRHAFIPFGGGPRQCIGNTFAMMEAQLTVAMIARRFRIAPAPDLRIRVETALTLRPGPDTWMLREPRTAAPAAARGR
jgi:cytochrome P450